MPDDKVYRSELTPVDFLRRSARVYPDKVAIVHGQRRYTYAQFAERVCRLASGLSAAGCSAGDRIAFLSPNAPALLEAHFAIPALGGVLVPINTRLQSSEIAHILADSGASALFVDNALYPRSPISISPHSRSFASPIPVLPTIPTSNFFLPLRPTRCRAESMTKKLPFP